MSGDRTPRERAIVLMGQGRIRRLVRAQTGLADGTLDAIVAELGGDDAVRRAGAAIRRGDRSHVTPAGGQPQLAAEATAEDPWCLPCPDCRSTDRPCDCLGADDPGDDEHLPRECVICGDRPAAPEWIEGRPICPTHATDLPGGDDVPPRKPEPIPVEPDVEDAITRGARRAEAARAALATSREARDQAADAALDAAATEPATPEVLDERTARTGSSTTNDVRVTVTAADPQPATATAEQAPGLTAVLAAPLARIVAPDGTETVLAEAVVEVELLPSILLEHLERPDGPWSAAAPLAWTVQRRLTSDGAVVVRGLAALLEDGE